MQNTLLTSIFRRKKEKEKEKVYCQECCFCLDLRSPGNLTLPCMHPQKGKFY